jgi:hypothetical protein
MKMKATENRKRHKLENKKGDLVLIDNRNKIGKENLNLGPKFLCLLKVFQMISLTTAKLNLSNNHRNEHNIYKVKLLKNI